MTAKLETAQIRLLEAQTRQIEASIEKDQKMSEWYDAQSENLRKSTVEIGKRIKEMEKNDD